MFAYESKSQNVEERNNFEDGGAIADLLQLEDLVQPLLLQLSPTKDCNFERKKIDEFTNVQHFIDIMENIISKYREKEWNRNYPNQRYNKLTQNDILRPKAYSSIVNNPMRGVFNPIRTGFKAIDNGSYYYALLFFDEALRNDPSIPATWFSLCIILQAFNRDDEAISAAKMVLQYIPDNFEAAEVLCTIYNNFNCFYQVCQTTFNWLKNKKCYKNIIPPGQTMEDRVTPELDENHLDYVKAIYIKAAQIKPKPKDIHPGLQVMLGWLHRITKDFDKAAVCQRNAIQMATDYFKGFLMNKLGLTLFHDDKPMEALEIFFKVPCHYNNNKRVSYRNIGYVYMYLKNFKESINYFKIALEPELLKYESEFQLKGNTVEDEYDLCVRLYCKLGDVKQFLIST